MKKYIYIISFICFGGFRSIAQVNLVPNPSFESYTACPTTFGQIEYATKWFSPNPDVDVSA